MSPTRRFWMRMVAGGLATGAGLSLTYLVLGFPLLAAVTIQVVINAVVMSTVEDRLTQRSDPGSQTEHTGQKDN